MPLPISGACKAIREAVIAFLVAAFLVGCATLPPGSDYPKTLSSALDHPEQTRLGKRFDGAARAQSGKSGFRVLHTGIDGFLIRAQMIDAAEKTLDLQYYIFRGDVTGKLLADALLRAADRGVRVRLLIDDGDRMGDDGEIAKLDAYPQFEIRIFNPFLYRGHIEVLRATEFVLNATRLDYRMHNKLLVADNAIALLGGRNIGDEYFQYDSALQFGDDDIFAVGPIVKQLSATFDEYWSSANAIPARALTRGKPSDAAADDYRKVLAEHRRKKQAEGNVYVSRLVAGEPLAGILSGKSPLTWTNAELVYDSPDKKRAGKNESTGMLMNQQMDKIMGAAQTELLVVTPFFVPGREGMQLFDDLRKRKVRVRALTNSLVSTSELLAHAGYMRYRLPLLQDGVELYEVRPVQGKPKASGGRLDSATSGQYALHAKIFVIDRQTIYIGSMNFDQRSMHINTEIGLVIRNTELARQMAARFEAMVLPANSYKVILRRDGADTSPRLFWRAEVNGKMIEYAEEPVRGISQRIAVDSLSLLPLEDEL